MKGALMRVFMWFVTAIVAFFEREDRTVFEYRHSYILSLFVRLFAVYLTTS